MAALLILEGVSKTKHAVKRRKKPTATRNEIVMSSTNKENGKCRICLEDGNIGIFKKDVQIDSNLVSNIRKFGDIEISEDDNLPKAMCEECYGLLCGAVRFRELAQESNEILHKIESNGTVAGDGADDEPAAGADGWAEEGEAESGRFECRKCQITFTAAEELRAHRRTSSHSESRARAQCSQCGARVSRGSLAAHVARRHCDARAHICHVCAKAFAVRGSLVRHLLVHTDELPFSCSRCAYRCRYRASLQEHARTHTGERPYACPACPAAFPSASNLRKHTRTHQLTHQLKCPHCDKGFHTQHKMKAHVKVEHLGLREHVCDVCGKQFGYKEKLSQHMKNVHKRPKKPSGRAPLYLEIEKRRAQTGLSVHNT